MASSKPIASVYIEKFIHLLYKDSVFGMYFRPYTFSLSLCWKKRRMPHMRMWCMCVYSVEIYVMEINVNKMKNQAHVRITWVRICWMAIIWKRIYTYTNIHNTQTPYTCTHCRSIYRDNNNRTKKDASWCFKLHSKVNKVDIYTLGRIKKIDRFLHVCERTFIYDCLMYHMYPPKTFLLRLISFWNCWGSFIPFSLTTNSRPWQCKDFPKSRFFPSRLVYWINIT